MKTIGLWRGYLCPHLKQKVGNMLLICLLLTITTNLPAQGGEYWQVAEQDLGPAGATLYGATIAPEWRCAEPMLHYDPFTRVVHAQIPKCAKHRLMSGHRQLVGVIRLIYPTGPPRTIAVYAQMDGGGIVDIALEDIF